MRRARVYARARRIRTLSAPWMAERRPRSRPMCPLHPASHSEFYAPHSLLRQGLTSHRKARCWCWCWCWCWCCVDCGRWFGRATQKAHVEAQLMTIAKSVIVGLCSLGLMPVPSWPPSPAGTQAECWCVATFAVTTGCAGGGSGSGTVTFAVDFGFPKSRQCLPPPICVPPSQNCRLKGSWIKDCVGGPTQTPVDLQAPCNDFASTDINCCPGQTGKVKVSLDCSQCKEPPPEE
jgi:hypothetical protein